MSGARRDSPGPEECELTPDDLFLFNEGSHSQLWRKLGAHVRRGGGVSFAVWAPNARSVAVIGDFNGWERGAHPMQPLGTSGLWTAVVPEAREGSTYKYRVVARDSEYAVDKADPFGFLHEIPPRTASIVRTLEHRWGDGAWLAGRARRQALDAPVSVYEVHLGSWIRDPGQPERHLSYGEIAPRLAEHCLRLGFTHVELLPVMEHPYYPSWGYQTTGYFAPTHRYGKPQDLMALIDALHQAGIGVILDWVPSHFPNDEHGLAYFDGTHLYEHADPRQGFHPDWKSAIFNYGRAEVRAFLVSSASFWLERYHADGLRVDAVASMLYLDYGRAHGQWVPNRHGGRENLEAVEFLRQLNGTLARDFPDAMAIAEESTAWPLVTRPPEAGGLGFRLKWDMGWMHDTLEYLQLDPIHRRHHHRLANFRGLYLHSENFMLPLSHDEVVHLKGSLLGRMPGDRWQRFANLRLLLASQWLQPGKKLLFMGGEFGQWREWNHEASLDWHLREEPGHAGVERLVAELNRVYRATPALHAGDCDGRGFEWVVADDAERSIVAWLRHAPDGSQSALVVVNATPVVRHQERFGLPRGGRWREVLNSDEGRFGGSGVGGVGAVEASPMPLQRFPASIALTLPPLAALVLVSEPESRATPLRGRDAGAARAE